MSNESIFGCFVSAVQPFPDADQDTKDLALQQGREFRTYVIGEFSISPILKKVNSYSYGKDIKLILFKFYVNPLPIQIAELKIEYRRREKSIGIPIVVNGSEFFDLSKKERYIFLWNSIFKGLNDLSKVVEQLKLDTQIKLLLEDLNKLDLTKGLSIH